MNRVNAGCIFGQCGGKLRQLIERQLVQAPIKSPIENADVGEYFRELRAQRRNPRGHRWTICGIDHRIPLCALLLSALKCRDHVGNVRAGSDEFLRQFLETTASESRRGVSRNLGAVGRDEVADRAIEELGCELVQGFGDSVKELNANSNILNGGANPERCRAEDFIRERLERWERHSFESGSRRECRGRIV